jgi:hypothetical protein
MSNEKALKKPAAQQSDFPPPEWWAATPTVFPDPRDIPLRKSGRRDPAHCMDALYDDDNGDD